MMSSLEILGKYFSSPNFVGVSLRGRDNFIWKIDKPRRSILPMFKLLFVMLAFFATAYSADLPSKKYINLAAIKTMVTAAEAEAKKRNVEVTICIVDESGNLLFLQKADAASLNTIVWAQKKARHAAFYRSASKDAADNVKKGNVEALAFPDYFPNQGGLPIQVDGQTIGGIAASCANPKSTKPSPKRPSRPSLRSRPSELPSAAKFSFRDRK